MIHARLPRMVEQFAAVGVDITREPMEVAPTAHYSMGGVWVDPETHATAVRGLFAAGEVAAGVHGANRLGGNSLAEILVFGRIAAEQAGAWAAHEEGTPLDEGLVAQHRGELARLGTLDGEQQRALIAALRTTMWECAGVVRSAPVLEQGLERLAVIRREAETGPAGPPDLPAALDLRAMLLTAEATIRSALLRTESRGAHQRSDYAETDPAWRRNIRIRSGAGDAGMVLSTVELPPITEEIAAVLEPAAVEQVGRLLE
jgi:succinate dehydrogenase / fumarate reductase flavoprotein subunit